MGFSLKKLLEGATAQVNPFDSGKTFATVVRNQPVQSQPAKTPPPSYGSNPFKQVVNRTRDVFDANTPQDYARRSRPAPMGVPTQSYQEQQRANPSNFTKLRNVVNGTAKVVGAPVIANVDIARAGIGQATGNQIARNNALKSATDNSLKIPRIGLDLAKGMVQGSVTIGKGLAQLSTDKQNAEKAQQNLIDQLNKQKLDLIKNAKTNGFTSQADYDRKMKYADNLWNNEAQARQAQISDQTQKYSDIDPVKQALAIADTGLTALSFGVAGATKQGAKAVAGETLKNQLQKGVGKEVATQLAKKAGGREILRQSALTGSMGGFQGAINPYIVKDKGTVTPTDVFSGALIGTALGGVLPATFVGAGYAKDGLKNLNRIKLNQAGAVGKNILDDGGKVKGAPIEKTPSVQKFGWNTEDTPQGTKLFNRNGKHVATITEKKGRFTASYTDGTRIATGSDANKLADDVARKTFYAQELPQSQNLGGTLRPDKAPEPYKNSAIQSDLSPERASAVQASSDKMKSALEFDKTPTPKKAYHSTASLEIGGGKLRASGADSAMGEGVYLHTNPETAKYAGAMQADGNIADQRALDINLKTDNLFKWADQEYPTPEQVALIKSRGYDGIYKKGGEIVVFDPNKIEIAKSGAPIEKTPLDALKAEARKYKSAEEFVNSQANLLHGTKADFTEFDPSLLGTNTNAPSAKKGFFFTDTPEIANHYANPGRNFGTAISKNLDDAFSRITERAKTEGLDNSLSNNSGAAMIVGSWPKVSPGTPKESVIKAVISKMDSLKTRFDSPSDIAKIERFKKLTVEELNNTPITELELFGKVMKSKVDFKNPLVIDDKGFRNGASYAKRIDEAIANGHDGLVIKNTQDPLRGNIYVALNKDQILTEKQLTDLYNQAHTQPTPKSEAPKGAPIEKTPQVGKTPNKVQIVGEQAQLQPMGTQKIPQTQSSLSQASGKVDDLASSTAQMPTQNQPKVAKTAQNQIFDNTSASTKQQRGFKSNIAKDTETPLPVYKDIPGYNVKPNAKTIGSAAKRVAKDPEGTYDRLLQNGIQKTDDSADALVLLRKLVDSDELDKANTLAKATAKAGTDFGQAVQIFSAFRKTTPDGALRDAWNIVNTYNVKNPKKAPIRISTAQQKEIIDLAKALDGVEYGTREWAVKAAQLERAKGLLTPNSFLAKVSTVQTMAQLLNPKTAIRNILGNGVLDLAEDLSRLPAVGLDKAFYKLGLVDSRNMVLPSMKTNWANKMLGLKLGVDDVNKGIRTTGSAGNYDLTREVFKPGSAGNKLEKLLGYELSSMDKAFYTGRYQSSLENMMKAQKLKVPTPEMKLTAEAEALYSTFQNNSTLSGALQKTKNTLNLGKEWGVGDLILKYPKTPGNIINVGLDYSPVGFLKGLKTLNDGIKLKSVKDIRGGELLIGRSLVGTGLIAGGAFLAKQGIITGKRDGDYDKSAADRDLGKGPFSFNITALGRLLRGEDTKPRVGDVTANYDWLQPNAIQLSMGANMIINSGSADKQINANLDSLGAGVDTITEQPLFQGIKSLSENLNTEKGGGVGKALTGIATDSASSFVPSIFNQAGQQLDNTKRSTYDNRPAVQALNKVLGRLPGGRNTLLPSLNTLGQEQKQYDVGGNNPFNVFLNPAFVTRVKDSPSLDLADKLNASTGETSQYPRSLTGKQTIDGTKTQLTAKQLFDLKKSVGQNTDKIFRQFNDNPIFQSKTDEDKVKALSGALTDINSAGKATIAAKNNLGQFAPDYNGKAKKLSTGAQKIVTGDYDVTSKLIGQDLPKNMNKEAVNVLASYDKAKAKEPNTNQTVRNTLKAWNNGRDLPVTNEIAKQWAEYEKKAAEGTLGKLEAVDEKKKILRNAYNSTLNEDEKDLYKLSKTRLKEAYDQGLITDANIQKALDAENKLYEAGLIDKKSLHGKLGLATGAKTSGRSGRSSRSGRSGGRKSTKKVAKLDLSSFSTYKSKRSSTNASLRKLLGSAKV